MLGLSFVDLGNVRGRGFGCAEIHVYCYKHIYTERERQAKLASASVTATHLSKLERRVVAIEESVVVHHGSVGSKLTSMTSLTRIINGYR